MFQICFVPLLTIFSMVVTHVGAIEVSLPQGLSMPGPIVGIAPEEPIRSVILEVTESKLVKEATFTIDFSPFSVKDVVVKNQNFQVDFAAESHRVTIHLNRISSALENSNEMAEIILDTSIFLHDTEEGNELGLGFGPFSFLSAQMVGRDNLPVSDVQLITGSWAVFSDIIGHLDIQIVNRDTQTPVAKVLFHYNFFVGSPGIMKGSKLTSTEGITRVPYLHEKSFFFVESPEGNIKLKPNLDVKVAISVLPTKDSNIQFEPVEGHFNLVMKRRDGKWVDFEPIQIPVAPLSRIEDWTRHSR